MLENPQKELDCRGHSTVDTPIRLVVSDNANSTLKVADNPFENQPSTKVYFK